MRKSVSLNEFKHLCVYMDDALRDYLRFSLELCNNFRVLVYDNSPSDRHYGTVLLIEEHVMRATELLNDDPQQRNVSALLRLVRHRKSAKLYEKLLCGVNDAVYSDHSGVDLDVFERARVRALNAYIYAMAYRKRVDDVVKIAERSLELVTQR